MDYCTSVSRAFESLTVADAEKHRRRLPGCDWTTLGQVRVTSQVMRWRQAWRSTCRIVSTRCPTLLCGRLGESAAIWRRRTGCSRLERRAANAGTHGIASIAFTCRCCCCCCGGCGWRKLNAPSQRSADAVGTFCLPYGDTSLVAIVTFIDQYDIWQMAFSFAKNFRRNFFVRISFWLAIGKKFFKNIIIYQYFGTCE